MTEQEDKPGLGQSTAASVVEALGPQVRAETARILRECRTPEALAEAGQRALEAAEAAFRQLQDADPSVRGELAGLDCRKYCAHCCYKTVSVTPAEVFYLARVIKATLKPKALTKLKARLAALEAKTRGLGPGARGKARLPCALLVGRLCAAHRARPASCRGFNSRDVDACARSLKHRDVEIPVYAPQFRLFGHAHLGLRGGLADSGLGSTHLELTPALRIALEEPDAAARYLAGEPVFRDAEQS